MGIKGLTRYRILILFWIFVFLVVESTGAVGAALFGGTFAAILLLFIIGVCSFIAMPVTLAAAFFTKRFRPFGLSVMNFIVVVVLCLVGFVFPEAAAVSIFRGEPRVVAQYRGTVNFANLTLRQNGKYDIYWVGPFGAGEFIAGTYAVKGDSIAFDAGSVRANVLDGRGVLLRVNGNLSFVRVFIDSSDYCDFMVKRNEGL